MNHASSNPDRIPVECRFGIDRSKRGEMKVRMMYASELEALDELIEYTADFEMKDFQNAEGDRRRMHIYNAIYRLAKWRGHNMSGWRNPSQHLPQPARRSWCSSAFQIARSLTLESFGRACR